VSKIKRPAQANPPPSLLVRQRRVRRPPARRGSARGSGGVRLAGTVRACLGGLRLRLHERLRPEPCQTVEIAPAPGVEPELEPLAAFKGRWSHVLVASPGSN
jgi:hypothetical protein